MGPQIDDVRQTTTNRGARLVMPIERAVAVPTGTEMPHNMLEIVRILP
jgi:hypothetical protein